MDLPPKIKIIDGVEYCRCAGHKDYHPCTEFTTERRAKHGIASSCKHYYRDRMNKKDSPKAKSTQEMANLVLTRMGYDIEEDVHQQFLERHNL